MEKTLSTTECIAKARGHIQRWELFQHLVHAISYVWWKYQVDTPTLPWVMEDGSEHFILLYDIPYMEKH